MTSPATLDHAGIAARVPHAGPMCLLDAVTAWSADEITCRITNHVDQRHPLRSGGGLLACHAVEYAAQAMAVHGALCAPADSPPVPGFLASARQVRLLRPRLDDRPGPLTVRAWRLAGNGGQALYRFELHDASGELLVEGRAAVVLDTPLAAPIATSTSATDASRSSP